MIAATIAGGVVGFVVGAAVMLGAILMLEFVMMQLKKIFGSSPRKD